MESILTPDDRAKLLPVIMGSVPHEAAFTIVEQVVREHISEITRKDL